MATIYIKAGELDRRITFRVKTVALNSFNEEIETWATHATVWGKVEENGGAEALIANHEIATRRALFVIRHRTDLNEQMQISWDGNTWDIETTRQLGRRRFLEISAMARVD